MTGPRSPILLPRWDLNPVVVKELRQAVRNWFVIGVLLLLLLILFVAMVMYVITESIGAISNPTLGRSVFQLFFGILSVGSMIFIPGYTGTRFAKEREDANVDLMFITTLTPGQIIRGKILCGVILTGLFFSVFMPFMAFTYLLRGIDLPSIFIVLVMNFITVTAMIHLAVFLASLPVSRNFKIGITAGTFFLGISWIGGLTIGAFEMINRGVGSRLGSWDFWGPALTFLVAAALIMRVLYIASVALITAPSANRALPVRVNTTICFLVAAAIPLLWEYFGGGSGSGITEKVSAIFGLPLLAVCLIVCVSSHDKLSLRIRRTIPTTPFKRALAFVFYSGAAGGLVWCALLATCILGLGVLALGGTSSGWLGLGRKATYSLTGGAITGGSDWLVFVSVVAYFFAYALTGLYLHRRFWPTRPPKLAGIAAVIVPLLFGVIPTLVLFFLNRFTSTSLDQFMPGNIFNLFVQSGANGGPHLITAAAWLTLMVFLNAPWFFRQFAAFKNYLPAGEKAADGSTLPPILD